MWKKGDLGENECGMVVSARPAGLSVAKTADLLGFFYTKSSLGFPENGLKNKKKSEKL